MTPWTAAYQAPPSMGFSRQEYWSELPLPSPPLTLLLLKLHHCISLLLYFHFLSFFIFTSPLLSVKSFLYVDFVNDRICFFSYFCLIGELAPYATTEIKDTNGEQETPKGQVI